jgi:hypothetical protein
VKLSGNRGQVDCLEHNKTVQGSVRNDSWGERDDYPSWCGKWNGQFTSVQEMEISIPRYSPSIQRHSVVSRDIISCVPRRVPTSRLYVLLLRLESNLEFRRGGESIN